MSSYFDKIASVIFVLLLVSLIVNFISVLELFFPLICFAVKIFFTQAADTFAD
jgi:hypothetical protein